MFKVVALFETGVLLLIIFFVLRCIATINRLLRRTLVRSVTLFSKATSGWW
jgi:hypothetical protein